MTKLIDLLNELAVAEAELRSIEEALDDGRPDEEWDGVEVSEEQMDQWDSAVEEKYDLMDRAVDALTKIFGMERLEAHTALARDRYELVKYAERTQVTV